MDGNLKSQQQMVKTLDGWMSTMNNIRSVVNNLSSNNRIVTIKGNKVERSNKASYQEELIEIWHNKRFTDSTVAEIYDNTRGSRNLERCTP
jgi:conjugal transfer/entry exclusion protein